MKYLLLILTLLTGINCIYAQDSYHIEIKVAGWSGKTVNLAYYYGESTYIKDTATVDSQGHFSFEGKETLPHGMYMTVIDKSRQFEFLIGEDQHFSLSTDTVDFIGNMHVTNDVNNEVLFSNMAYNRRMNDRAQPLVKVVQDSLSTDKEKHEAQVKLRELNESVLAHQARLVEENQSTLVGVLLETQLKVDVPKDLPKEEQFRYYRDHYWDHFDLSNEALIRIPATPYLKKMEEYLDNLYAQSSDSIMLGIEEIVSRAKANTETYKYAVWNLCIKYQNPKFMGQDQVFVNLYDKYFASGEMDFWANNSLKDNLKERADQLRKSMIGQKAQNLIMFDENLQRVSLYDLKNKYTVIYFYDPDCGHCKKETPKLKAFYDQTKHDVEVFAVSADTSMVKMKKYIKDMNMTWVNANGPRTITPQYQKLYDANSTPTIYVLDEEKKIIAKKIDAARIEDFLNNHEHIKEL